MQYQSEFWQKNRISVEFRRQLDGHVPNMVACIRFVYTVGLAIIVISYIFTTDQILMYILLLIEIFCHNEIPIKVIYLNCVCVCGDRRKKLMK